MSPRYAAETELVPEFRKKLDEYTSLARRVSENSGSSKNRFPKIDVAKAAGAVVAAGAVFGGSHVGAAQSNRPATTACPGTLNAHLCRSVIGQTFTAADCGGSGLPIDFNGNGMPEFVIQACLGTGPTGFFEILPFPSTPTTGMDYGVACVAGAWVGSIYSLPGNVPAGYPIGPAAPFLSSCGPAMFKTHVGASTTTTIGNFVSVGVGNLGLQFHLNGGSIHYGWVSLNVATGQVVESTYNTIADSSVAAGDTGSELLPVELAEFSATAEESAVVLEWETAIEINNAGFEIQHRQSDAVGAWEVVDFVGGMGTTSDPHRYAYRVEKLLPGVHVFRLKQLDFDGAYEFSQSIEVAVEVPGTHMLTSAYPNPFNPRARFSLAVATDQHVRIEVVNTTGQNVAVLHDGVLSAGSLHGFRIDGSEWPSGAYLYKVTGETFSESRQVALLK